MSESRSRMSALLLAATFVLSVSQLSSATTPPTPNPPAKVCIGASCVSAPGGSMKWHPGHYMSLRGGRKVDAEMGYIDAISTEASLQGILVEFRWGQLETAPGKYDFSLIDQYLARLKALKTMKRLVIRLEERSFGNVAVGQHAPVPAYLWTDPTYMGGDVAMSHGLVARIWDQPVMDRLILLYQALGAKYDSDPYVEGISSSETAISFGAAGRPAPSDFTTHGLLAQWERLTAAARQAFPHSMVNIETNFLGSNEQMEELIKAMLANQVAAGGPDTGYAGHGASQSERIVAGIAGSGTDYRGNIVVKSEVQSPDWRAGVADCTPAGIFATAYDTNQSNYIFWDRMTWSTDARQNWYTGILPFIRSVNGKVHSACPASLSNVKCNVN